MDEEQLLARIVELERRVDWLYRATGYGTAYAGAPLPGVAAARPGVPAGAAAPAAREVLELIRQGRKIQAVKVYRDQTGVGLKQARDAVERLERDGV